MFVTKHVSIFLLGLSAGLDAEPSTIPCLIFISLHIFLGKMKSAEGIFRTNNFSLGQLNSSSDHAVFHFMSR